MRYPQPAKGLLRERVDRARWLAIALGFADALLILQPAADVAVRVLFLRAPSPIVGRDQLGEQSSVLDRTDWRHGRQSLAGSCRHRAQLCRPISTLGIAGKHRPTSQKCVDFHTGGYTWPQISQSIQPFSTEPFKSVVNARRGPRSPKPYKSSSPAESNGA